MGTNTPVFKKVAITLPMALIVRYFVVFMITIKGNFKMLKLNAFRFLRIEHSLFNLANHA